MAKMTLGLLQSEVLDWAKEKDLLNPDNADKQFMKFMEEVFEFKTEMDLKETRWLAGIDLSEILEPIEMEMGDIFVTLIILCEQLNISPREFLEKAYGKIKDRKGQTINGVFVKEGEVEKGPHFQNDLYFFLKDYLMDEIDSMVHIALEEAAESIVKIIEDIEDKVSLELEEKISHELAHKIVRKAYPQLAELRNKKTEEDL